MIDHKNIDSGDVMLAIFDVAWWCVKIALFILVALATLGFIKMGITYLFA